MLDSVDLTVTYNHRWHTAEIELTLAGNGQVAIHRTGWWA
jgi:hypothetical protein